MQDIWFTSDLHMWHSNILKYNPNRSYPDVQTMNEGLIRNWNSVVKPGDIVYCLGDFSFNYRSIELYSYRLNGKKYFVPGNHDFCHSYNKKSRDPVKRTEWIDKYEQQGWIVLPEQTEFNIIGHSTVNICHMPYAVAKDHLTEQGDDKYAKYRPKDDGRWLLHGHIHSTSQKHLDKRMIDVGVDANNCFPINLNDIKALIDANSK